ncbi:MAG: hypothetical protein ACJAXZ_001237 [Akkermansiaceae bacterium]
MSAGEITPPRNNFTLTKNMKTVNAIAAAAVGLVGSASAFSLDFSAYTVGVELDPDLVVSVSGFGTVTFTEAPSNNPSSPPSELEITDAYVPDPGIGFQNGEQLEVTFQADNPNVTVQDVTFVFTGVNSGENFSVATTSNPDDGKRLISFSGEGSDGGAGLYQVHFTAVPEPSSTLLVALSALGLVARRRR